MAQANQTQPAPNIWATKPLTDVNPLFWPSLAPQALAAGAQYGGPNWIPVVSPLLSVPVAAGEGLGRGIEGVLGGMNDKRRSVMDATMHFFSQPGAQAAPTAKAPTSTAAPWEFNVPTSGPNISGIVGAESGGNPNAKNPYSTAAGLGQFIQGTWMDADLRKRAGFDKIDDKTWESLRQGEAGIPAQLAMTQAYAQRNAETWEKRYSRAPDAGQLYGMHFLDAQPFIYLTEAAAATPQADASKMFPEAAKANPSVFYKDKARKQPRNAAELYAEITRRGGGAQSNDPWTFPQLQGLDPQQMMGMIPNPTRPNPVSLPNAPQMALSPDRPAEEQVDIASQLALLQQFAPKPFDAAEANKGRLPAVLAGIAQGAANADGGWGDILAGIGAGAGKAGAAWDAQTKEEKKAAEEAQRLFGLSMAKLNIDLQGENRGVRNRNAERKWQDGRDKVVTEFQNAQAQWETKTKEYLINQGLDQQYLRDLDAAKMMRARVGLSALEQNTEFQNAQATGQQGLDLKRYIFENEEGGKAITDAQAKTVNTMLSGIGVDPKLAVARKDTVGLNAMQAAHYIASNNKTAALNALGMEMAYTGRMDLLPEGKVRNEIAALSKQSPELAGAALGRLLNEGEAADPGSALTWAKTMAANGYPVGQLFLRHLKQTPANGAQAPAATQGAK